MIGLDSWYYMLIEDYIVIILNVIIRLYSYDIKWFYRIIVLILNIIIGF